MTRDDFSDIIGRVPETDHSKLILGLRNGQGITLEVMIRQEDTYICLRGREAGQTDDSRGFFVPYDEIVSLKIDREVTLAEMAAMFGVAAPAARVQDAASVETPPPVAAAQAPADIARQNLLERIRAVKASTAAGRK